MASTKPTSTTAEPTTTSEVHPLSTEQASAAGHSPAGNPADAPSSTERALATLWLHIGRFEILKLSLEEREALADAVDKVNQHDTPEDFEPTHRWWHEDAPLVWNLKYAW